MKKLISKALLAVILTVGLVGCTTITPQELINAEDACKEHKGVYSIEVRFIRDTPFVNCYDGHWENLTR